MITSHKPPSLRKLAAWLVLAAAAVTDPVSSAFAYQRTGSVYMWKDPFFANALQNWAPLETRSGIVDMAVGIEYGLALKANGDVVEFGTLFAFGPFLLPPASPGQVYTRPTPDMLTGVKAVATGDRYAFVVKRNGAVLGWGFRDNGTGVLNIPTAAQSGVRMLRQSGDHVVAIKDDGTVVTWGLPFLGAAPADVAAIGAGKPVSVSIGSGFAGHGFAAFVMPNGTIQILGSAGEYAASRLAGIHDALEIEFTDQWANVLRGGGPGCTQRLDRIGIESGYVTGDGYPGPGYSGLYLDGCSVKSSFANNDLQYTLGCRTDGSLVGWTGTADVATSADAMVAGTFPPGLNNVVAVGGGTYFAAALTIPNRNAPRAALLASATDFANLLATLNDPNGRTVDGHHLRDAIEAVNDASKANLWLPGDNLHVAPKHGDKVFEGIKKAVGELTAAKFARNSVLADATLDELIASLLASASEIAQAAIDDATQAHGDARKLAAARAAFADADADALETRRNSQTEAINDFREAWKKAQDSVK